MGVASATVAPDGEEQTHQVYSSPRGAAGVRERRGDGRRRAARRARYAETCSAAEVCARRWRIVERN
jgi:hypothetical protein